MSNDEFIDEIVNSIFSRSLAESSLYETVDGILSSILTSSSFEGFISPDTTSFYMQPSSRVTFSVSLSDYMSGLDIDDIINEVVQNESFEDTTEVLGRDERRKLDIDEFKYSENKKDNLDEKECSICLNQYSDDDLVVRLLNCPHLFHSTCIREWYTYKNSCPICRTDITSKS